MVDFTRRSVLTGGAAFATVGVEPLPAGEIQEPSSGAPAALPLTLLVNGQGRDVTLDARVTLLDALRELARSEQDRVQQAGSGQRLRRLPFASLHAPLKGRPHIETTLRPGKSSPHFRFHPAAGTAARCI
jgi:hypothetical protein